MKKIGKLLICLALTASFALTGCSLVQRNTERYLNRTVASFGEITISKQDLLSAYNSYGYQYVQYYGLSTERALKLVIDSLVNNKIRLERAKEVVKIEDDGSVSYYKDGTKVATLYNKNVWNNEIWGQVFDSLNEQILTFENEIRKSEGLETVSSDETEDSPTYSPYKEYEKKVVYDDVDGWKVVYDGPEKADETKTTIGDFVQELHGENEISEKAIKRFLKKIELNYKSKNLTVDDLKTVNQQDLDGLYANLGMTSSEKIAFLYELERLYNAYEESKYISQLEVIYKQFNENVEELNEKIVDYYKQLVEDSYEKYAVETNNDGYSAYVKAMNSDYTKVYYHKDYGTNDKGERKAYVAVSHVLIKLTDEQKKEMEDLEKIKGELPEDEYQSRRQAILDAVYVYERNLETGFDYPAKVDEVTGEVLKDERGLEIRVKEIDLGNGTTQKVDVYAKTVAEVRAEIVADLENYSTVEEKAVAFNKYIYMYGQDTGMINATHYYAIPLDSEAKTDYVSVFVDEARRLANETEDSIYGGNVGNAVLYFDETGSASYSGYHIIFNAGIITNDKTIEEVRNLDSENGAHYLYNKKIMLGTNKTVYDYIYDTIYTSRYSYSENSLIETAKANTITVYYEDAYKDLY